MRERAVAWVIVVLQAALIALYIDTTPGSNP